MIIKFIQIVCLSYKARDPQFVNESIFKN